MAIVPFRRNPIAWLQLRFQKAQTAAAVLGIAFTTILLFMQIGFRSGFLDTFIDIPTHLRGDLFMVNAGTSTILRPAIFSQRRLYQALAFDEVQSITPIYMGGINMLDPTGKPHLLRNVAVIAFPVVKNPFDITAIDQNFEALKRNRVFLIDELSRPAFMPVVKKVRETGRKSIEVRAGDRQMRVSFEGLFALGPNVTNDANILTSDRTFFELLKRDPNLINIGLITLRPGADVAATARKLNDYLPRDVTVFDKASLLKSEVNYYEHGTALGSIFRSGLGGAILIGIVILYQILFQIISKYVRDYATLKAIGVSQGMLRLIVLRASMILAVVGYVFGLVVSFFMYRLFSSSASLRFTMTVDKAAVVFVMVCLICLVSALLAIRKLRDADPADLFG